MQPKTYLPNDYTPSVSDVLCGRGTQYFNHLGNILFRQIIASHLPRYEATCTKLQKSIAVVEIVDVLRSRSDGTANFIRFDKAANLWYALDDAAARQKVGQTMRETITQRDPEKKAAKATKRVRNYVRRRLIRRGSDSDHSTAGSLCTLESEGGGDSFIEPLPLCVRTQSAPVSCFGLELAALEPPLTVRRTKSESATSLEDVALALHPPAFASVSSQEWFNASSLSDEDFDVSGSIDRLFDKCEADGLLA